jgi:hypothetical protein
MNIELADSQAQPGVPAYRLIKSGKFPGAPI